MLKSTLRPVRLSDIKWAHISFALVGQMCVLPFMHFVMTGEHLKDKLALNTRVMRFMPIGAVMYRQAMQLAQANQQEQAKSM